MTTPGGGPPYFDPTAPDAGKGSSAWVAPPPFAPSPDVPPSWPPSPGPTQWSDQQWISPPTQQQPGQWSGQQWAPPPEPRWVGSQWIPPPTPPPPPGGRGSLIALLAVGAIVLAGLGVGTFLLVRASTAVPPTDFQSVRTPFLSYAVPSDWSTTSTGLPQNLLGAEFTGVAEAPAYECRGAPYLRGSAGSALVQDARPAEQVASAFARGLGDIFYTQRSGARPEVTLTPARAVDVDAASGALVEATVRTPDDDGCLATEGTLLVVALPITGPDGSDATALLVVNGDTAGGPASPPVPARETLDAIVDSARLATI